MTEPYFERDGIRMPPETDLAAGDITVIPQTIEDEATDWGRYVGEMGLHIAAAQLNCIVCDLERGPSGEIRRLIAPEDSQ